MSAGKLTPVLMKLLGHVNPEMTMRYVQNGVQQYVRNISRAGDADDGPETATAAVRIGEVGLTE